MRTQPLHSGFTLLEVILALAVFGVSAVLLSELMNLGVRNARAARDGTQAQLLCETIMTELLTGVRPLQSEPNAQLQDDPTASSVEKAPWISDITVEVIDTVDGAYNMLALLVTVRENNDDPRKQEFTMARWILDPDTLPEEEEEAATSTSSSTTSSTSSAGV